MSINVRVVKLLSDGTSHANHHHLNPLFAKRGVSSKQLVRPETCSRIKRKSSSSNFLHSTGHETVTSIGEEKLELWSPLLDVEIILAFAIDWMAPVCYCVTPDGRASPWSFRSLYDTLGERAHDLRWYNPEYVKQSFLERLNNAKPRYPQTAISALQWVRYQSVVHQTPCF